MKIEPKVIDKENYLDTINKLVPNGKKRLLIDADIYAYRASSGAETEIDWGDDIWSLTMDMKEARKFFCEQINIFKKRLECDDVVLCFSDGDNFRKKVNPSYKSQRRGTRKPVGYKALVTWAREEWESISIFQLEADDVLGVIATMPGKEVVVVSDDKDLETIPCTLFKPQRDEVIHVSEQDADHWFLTQSLTGDTTDGYPGLKGVGQVKAKRILGFRSDWSHVEQAYIKAGQTKQDALLQARMARILRSSDYDFNHNNVLLWEPGR